MADIKITQQMIDFYRNKPGNSVLLDSAIIDLINKDIETGKLPKEFALLATDVQKAGYSIANSNLFGYGFDINANSGLQFERTTTQEEQEEINKINYRKTFIESVIREEIDDNNFKVEFKEYTELKTANGTKIILEAPNGKPRQVYIENNDKIIKINCHKTGIEKSIINKRTNIMTQIDYDNSGSIIRERKYDTNNQTEIYNKDYEEVEKAKQLASEIVKDLTNTNFLGFKSIRDSLPQNLEKITSDNILYVMEEYHKLTGEVLINDIYKYTKNENYQNQLNEKFSQKMNVKNQIEDLNSFLGYTGIRKEFNEMWKNGVKNYDSFADVYEILTGRKSFEFDFRNSNLDKNEKDRYLTMIRLKAFDSFMEKDFKPNFHVENAQINNNFYKSDNIYDIQFGMLYEPIIIRNKTTGIERTLDLRSVFQKMSTIDRAKMWGIIQKFPPETLDDLAIETSNVTAHSGNEFVLQFNNADGLYLGDIDKIIFNASSVKTCIHELGHAIDYNYKNNSNAPRTSNNDFMQIFEQEISNYRAKGNQCFTKGENGTTQGNDGYYNYCTFDEREMFAECYTLLMLGDCNSKDTILNHFPNCLKATENLLKEIRKLPDNVRTNQNGQ